MSRRRAGARAFLGALLGACAGGVTDPAAGPTLVWRGVLPARTFAAGPVCGTALHPRHTLGEAVPFPSQPVQGFSELVRVGDDEFLALCDNGFGAMENSADFRLRVYRLRLDFAQPGRVEVAGFLELSDPDRLLPFPIAGDATGDPHLSGLDLDPESMQRAPDGTLWIGDEFGPWLLHFDGAGRLIDPPFELPDPAGGVLRSPFHPTTATSACLRHLRAAGRIGAVLHLEDGQLDAAPEPLDPGRIHVPTLARAGHRVVVASVHDPARGEALTRAGAELADSGPPARGAASDVARFVTGALRGPVRVPVSGGIEALARSPDGRRLVAVLEKPLLGDGERRVLALEFDPAGRRFTGRTWWVPLSPRAASISAFALLADDQGVALERDDTQADLDGYKSIRRVHLWEDGSASSEALVDLLHLADPRGVAPAEKGAIGTGGGTFAMPFLTLESLVVLDERRLLVVNDNNYPLTSGRRRGTPDDSEFIVVALAQALGR